VSGLGAVFIQGGWLRCFVSALYKLAFRTSNSVFFQNKDDLGLFLLNKLVKVALTDVLSGFGINLQQFTPTDNADRKAFNYPFRIL
jgi:hypothetical protein